VSRLPAQALYVNATRPYRGTPPSRSRFP